MRTYSIKTKQIVFDRSTNENQNVQIGFSGQLSDKTHTILVLGFQTEIVTIYFKLG